MGTSLCSNMSNAGKVFGRSSMPFFLAVPFTACVYLPSVTIIPLSTSASFIAFVNRFIDATPTVASPGTHHTSALVFSRGISIM